MSFSNINPFNNYGNSALPDQFVVINSINDFPVPNNGVITLENEKVYLINRDITTSNRFVIPPGNNFCTFWGPGNINTITYTGSDVFLTCIDGAGFRSITVNFVNNGTGTFINSSHSNPSGSEISLLSQFTLLAGWLSLGYISDTRVTILDSELQQNISGFTFTDNSLIVISRTLIQNWFNIPNIKFFSFYGSIDKIQISSCGFNPLPNECCLYLDSALTTNGVVINGNLLASSNGGCFYAPGSLDETDKRFSVYGNERIKDSTVYAHVTFQNNSDITTISATNTPVQIQGTYVDAAERVITTAAGRMTYIGLEDVRLNTFATLSPVVPTGTKNPYSFYVNHGNETNNTISAFTDAGGGQITVTHATWDKHTPEDGSRVVIRNTTNYNGTYVASNTTGTSFEITETFVSDDATGDWSIIDEISKSTVALSNGDIASVAILHSDNYSTNDYIELFVEDNTGTVDITVTDLIWNWNKA